MGAISRPPACKPTTSTDTTTRFPGTTEASPHAHEQHVPKPKILSTILDHIGDTPLVRINKIAKAEGIQVGAMQWNGGRSLVCRLWTEGDGGWFGVFAPTHPT